MTTGQDAAQMAGHVTIQELDWSNEEHYQHVKPPFDYVLAADCVYHEQIVEDFLRTVLAMTHSKSTGQSICLAAAAALLLDCQHAFCTLTGTYICMQLDTAQQRTLKMLP